MTYEDSVNPPTNQAQLIRQAFKPKDPEPLPVVDPQREDPLQSQQIEKIPEKVESLPAVPESGQFEKNMVMLQRLLDVFRGRVDVRHRLDAILSPKNPLTSSNLNPNQVEYVRTCKWLATTWPELYGFLNDDADKLLGAMMSKGGWGVEQSIKMVSAIEGNKILAGMIGTVGDGKKSRNPLKLKSAKATDRE